MTREQLIRVTTDVAVGASAVWILKLLGVKQGSLAALVGAAFIHEMLDAPIAARIQDAI